MAKAAPLYCRRETLPDLHVGQVMVLGLAIAVIAHDNRALSND